MDYRFEDGDAAEIIDTFQEIISIVVQKYARMNTIHPYGEADMSQYVRLKLTENLDGIRSNYRGQAKVKTYVSAVIRNYCLEFVRKHAIKLEEEEWRAEQPAIVAAEGTHSPLRMLYVKEEMKRLARILQLFGSQRPKLELVLRAYYRNRITPQHLQAYAQARKFNYPECFDKLARTTRSKDQDVFACINTFLNEVDGQSNSADAVRKWTVRKMEELLDLLNGPNHERSYTRETLGLLLDYHFMNDAHE